MTRQGRCRCGEILQFRRGPDGYKVRCPKCSAVVRLRVAPRAPVRAQAPEYAPTQLMPPLDLADFPLPSDLGPVPDSLAPVPGPLFPGPTRPGAQVSIPVIEMEPWVSPRPPWWQRPAVWLAAGAMAACGMGLLAWWLGLG
jgi:hypothetical protein